MFVEMILIISSIGIIYSQKFFWITFSTFFIFIMVTYIGTEWRAKYFKELNKRDSSYVQKASDSLLNFETVKYFNAEDHEQRRFQVPLLAYKDANVKVTKSMVTVNVSEGMTVCSGLTITLYLAYMDIQNGKLNVSDFMLLNLYILQLYNPLKILGLFWRFIRQAWSDVEMVIDILRIEKNIKEAEDPIDAKIDKGEIEFKNVCFTYDQDLKKEE